MSYQFFPAECSTQPTLDKVRQSAKTTYEEIRLAGKFFSTQAAVDEYTRAFMQALMNDYAKRQKHFYSTPLRADNRPMAMQRIQRSDTHGAAAEDNLHEMEMTDLTPTQELTASVDVDKQMNELTKIRTEAANSHSSSLLSIMNQYLSGQQYAEITKELGRRRAPYPTVEAANRTFSSALGIGIDRNQQDIDAMQALNNIRVKYGLRALDYSEHMESIKQSKIAAMSAMRI